MTIINATPHFPADAAFDFRLAVRQLLCESAQQIFAVDNTPQPIHVQFHDGAALVTATVNGRLVQIVVKRVPRAGSADAANAFATIHNRVRSRDETLANLLPALRWWNNERGLLVFDYLEGRSQYQILRDVLRTTDSAQCEVRERCAAHVISGAQAFLRVHAVAATDVELEGLGQSNRAFIPGFDLLWKNPAVQRIVPRDQRDPARFLRAFSSAFFERDGTALLHGDAQPGNLVVDRDNRVRFIDLGYTAGSPAREVASYLVGMDTLGLRHPLSRPREGIAEWKQLFVNAYAEHAPCCFWEELVFFYVRALLRHFVRHWQQFRFLRWYLAGYYRPILCSFLARSVQDGSEKVLPTSRGIFAG